MYGSGRFKQARLMVTFIMGLALSCVPWPVTSPSEVSMFGVCINVFYAL